MEFVPTNRTIATLARSPEEIRAKQTTINRLRRSANAEADEIKRIEDDITSLNQDLECHRKVAQESHQYFVDVTKRCAKQWADINELEHKS